jgi:hypothetical protein
VADSNVPITAGAGTAIDTYQIAGGDHQQVIREAPASAATAPTSWTLSGTGTTSTVAADTSRRCVILTNTSTNGTVYLRYDGTAPTTAAGGWHDRIAPGFRLVLEKEVATLALSFIADIASGYLEIALFTAA